MRCWRRSAVAGVICCLAPAALAHGQPATPVDPESPAGVEYQLPLDQARKNATGGGAARPGARGGRTGAVPLFGAGIQTVRRGAARRAVESGGTDRGGPTATRGGSRPGGVEGEGSDEDRPGGAAPITRSALSSPDDGGGPTAIRIAGIALAVLLLGTLLGLVLRRGLRQPEH